MTYSRHASAASATLPSSLISVIIRAHNEEKWLPSCLTAVRCQDYPAVEIIVVDNHSTDNTVAIAHAYGAVVVSTGPQQFNYSRAINIGVSASAGSLIAILSAHCIPADDLWLAHMAMHFRDPVIAAVYGRQEPLPDSSPSDKRDLWTTFGLDRKRQKRDFFFHNANSLIRRSVWETLPFNENIHGVEDQDWARKVLRQGASILYEPLATVFHHHGIHHSRNEERAQRVVEVIERIKRNRT